MKKILFIFFFVYYSILLLPIETGMNVSTELRYRLIEARPPAYVWSQRFKYEADCSGQMYSIYGKAGVEPRYETEKFLKEMEEWIKDQQKLIDEKWRI